ncbi:hypothetical protein L202_05166 [Cryptococcus amylolentus CBS 6039]|uniref:NAD-dependent epimerase/dehydratase domain-containing protein n=1 Tax=Cryptococcus amylolentus CBS 6039 TaxID=1295533 RepID=A0A1E3HJH1_9TREE|nr:hypothetical protein L202_05166 [Cryptococcus amylolentus CBS 6039]ODN76500.1 hypothetical protein L202_05166 [Cryptococcus amylolentus CBS 6039]
MNGDLEYTWQEFTDKLHLIRPDLSSFFPLGQPKSKSEGGGYTPAKWAFDAKKSREELGIEYRTMEETLRDAVGFFETIGAFQQGVVEEKKD